MLRQLVLIALAGTLLSHAEERFYGFIMPSDILEDAKPLHQPRSASHLPSEYDAAKLGLVTSVKDQGSCGSCAAFAATALHESCFIKAGADPNCLDLSEQYLLECGLQPLYNMSGCDGAYSHVYSQLVIEGGGQVPSETDFNYIAETKNRCPNIKPTAERFKVTGFSHDGTCGEESLKNLLIQHGTVVVAVWANNTAFDEYERGSVMVCPENTIDPDHVVQLIGYGTTEDGVNYWKAKNSWGIGWGDDGFFRIRRGHNDCNIESYCQVVTCEKGY